MKQELFEIQPLLYGNCSIIKCLDRDSTEITIPRKIDGMTVIQIWDYSFSLCTNLRSVIIPDSVINIGAGAFEQCEKLNHIEIPMTIEHIGEYAFSDCINLTGSYIFDINVFMGENAFLGCRDIEIKYTEIKK